MISKSQLSGALEILTEGGDENFIYLRRSGEQYEGTVTLVRHDSGCRSLLVKATTTSPNLVRFDPVAVHLGYRNRKAIKISCEEKNRHDIGDIRISLQWLEVPAKFDLSCLDVLESKVLVGMWMKIELMVAGIAQETYQAKIVTDGNPARSVKKNNNVPSSSKVLKSSSGAKIPNIHMPPVSNPPASSQGMNTERTVQIKASSNESGVPTGPKSTAQSSPVPHLNKIRSSNDSEEYPVIEVDKSANTGPKVSSPTVDLDKFPVPPLEATTGKSSLIKTAETVTNSKSPPPPAVETSMKAKQDTIARVQTEPYSDGKTKLHSKPLLESNPNNLDKTVSKDAKISRHNQTVSNYPTLPWAIHYSAPAFGTTLTQGSGTVKGHKRVSNQVTPPSISEGTSWFSIEYWDPNGGKQQLPPNNKASSFPSYPTGTSPYARVVKSGKKTDEPPVFTDKPHVPNIKTPFLKERNFSEVKFPAENESFPVAKTSGPLLVRPHSAEVGPSVQNSEKPQNTVIMVPNQVDFRNSTSTKRPSVSPENSNEYERRKLGTKMESVLPMETSKKILDGHVVEFAAQFPRKPKGSSGTVSAAAAAEDKAEYFAKPVKKSASNSYQGENESLENTESQLLKSKNSENGGETHVRKENEHSGLSRDNSEQLTSAQNGNVASVISDSNYTDPKPTDAGAVKTSTKPLLQRIGNSSSQIKSPRESEAITSTSQAQSIPAIAPPQSPSEITARVQKIEGTVGYSKSEKIYQISKVSRQPAQRLRSRAPSAPNTQTECIFISPALHSKILQSIRDPLEFLETLEDAPTGNAAAASPEPSRDGHPGNPKSNQDASTEDQQELKETNSPLTSEGTNDVRGTSSATRKSGRPTTLPNNVVNDIFSSTYSGRETVEMVEPPRFELGSNGSGTTVGSNLKVEAACDKVVVGGKKMELDREILVQKLDAVRKNVQWKDRMIRDLKEQLKRAPVSSSRIEGCDAAVQVEADSSIGVSLPPGNVGVTDGTSPGGGNACGYVAVENLMKDSVVLPQRHQINGGVCPAKLEVLGCADACVFRGCDSTRGRGWLSTVCQVESGDEIRFPMYLKLFALHGQPHQLQVCLPKRSSQDLNVTLNCFLQIRFYPTQKFPAKYYHFNFETKNGTCTNGMRGHWKQEPCQHPTFTSKAVISLGEGKKAGDRSQTWPATQLGAQVRIVLLYTCPSKMNRCLGVFPSPVEKLDRLVQWSLSNEPWVIRKVVFLCGEKKSKFVIPEPLLRDFTPVFEAMLDEQAKEKKLAVQLHEMSDVSMTAFYNYVHGRDSPHWYGDVSVNLEILRFSRTFLIVEMMLKCAGNLLRIPDEKYLLEHALALVEIGKKLALSCLMDKGIQWLKRRRNEEAGRRWEGIPYHPEGAPKPLPLFAPLSDLDLPTLKDKQAIQPMKQKAPGSSNNEHSDWKGLDGGSAESQDWEPGLAMKTPSSSPGSEGTQPSRTPLKSLGASAASVSKSALKEILVIARDESSCYSCDGIGHEFLKCPLLR